MTMEKAKFELGQIVVCTEYDSEDQFPMRIDGIDDSRMGHPEVFYTCSWDGMTEEQSDWNPFLESQLALYIDPNRPAQRLR
jgi:hypothetical protein